MGRTEQAACWCSWFQWSCLHAYTRTIVKFRNCSGKRNSFFLSLMSVLVTGPGSCIPHLLFLANGPEIAVKQCWNMMLITAATISGCFKCLSKLCFECLKPLGCGLFAPPYCLIISWWWKANVPFISEGGWIVSVLCKTCSEGVVTSGNKRFCFPCKVGAKSLRFSLRRKRMCNNPTNMQGGEIECNRPKYVSIGLEYNYWHFLM